MQITTRAEWGASAPNSPLTSWNPDNLLGLVVHHFAIPRSAATAAGSDDLMRSVQRTHKAGQFTDIAYNHCFDKFGQIFEGRGFGFQTGAHTPLNSTHASLCYIGNSDLDGFPEAAQDAAGWLMKQWFNKGVGVKVFPHGHISADPTGCPGDKAEAWVTSGAWKADLPSTRRVRYLVMDEGEALLQGPKVPMTQSKEEMVRFLKELHREHPGLLHIHLKEEGLQGRVNLVRKVTVA